jgi:hypothetical protein
MKITWVGQEDSNGCALAVLSMLTGTSYLEVKKEIDSQDGHGHDGDWNKKGVTHITIDRYLIDRGYYLQRIYSKFRPKDFSWPPDPWAENHFASVEQPSGRSHFVVMDCDGIVLDPLREGKYKLKDWEYINNVVGLYKP